MRAYSRVLLLGLMIVALGAQVCFGAGFALYEGSARGNALGGTLVARADDASAIFYNPAGITQLPGLQMMVGGTFILPGVDVTTTDPRTGQKTTTSSDATVWMPPHLYATYQFNDSLWFGLGVFGQFGLGTLFPADWTGRYNSYDAEIKSLTFNPTVAFKVNDQISLAGGIDLMWFDLRLKNKIDALRLNNPMYDVRQNLTGNSFSAGWNLALHYKPLDWMAAGISYRSKVKQNVTGDVDFNKPQILEMLAPQAFPDTGVSGAITLPDTLSMGIMFKPWERFSIEVDGTWVRWSTYESLTISYDQPIIGPPFVPAPVSAVKRNKNWHDTWRAQIGFEYKALDWLDLRAGYIFDESPVEDAYSDYLLPANDRHLFSFGPGFHWRNWTLDLSYTYIWITDREFKATDYQLSQGVLDSSFDNGYAHLAGLSLSYKF